MQSMKPFVEDCIILESKQLKKTFGRIRKIEQINDMLLTNTGNEVWFWVEYEADSFLVVSLINSEPQRIVLSNLMLRYGDRTLLRCSCGYKAAKLYAPKGETEFKCRSCWNLRYKSSNFNRFSRVDQLGKEMALNDKLAEEYLKITRPIYSGLPTKRAIRIEMLKYKARLIREKHLKRNTKKELISNWNKQRSQYI
jgi:hypothetical protein